MMAEISKDSKTVSSTNTAIGYYEKEYITQSQYYGEQDPRPMKTVIDIAQCHRNIKDSQASINLLREQMQVVPFKNTPNHTIVTKTLYTMGLAYLDLGEFSYALKCFEKGLNMLQ
jgi:tetratricopeptide (TPR) repeat protein